MRLGTQSTLLDLSKAARKNIHENIDSKCNYICIINVLTGIIPVYIKIQKQPAGDMVWFTDFSSTSSHEVKLTANHLSIQGAHGSSQTQAQQGREQSLLLSVAFVCCSGSVSAQGQPAVASTRAAPPRAWTTKLSVTVLLPSSHLTMNCQRS